MKFIISDQIYISEYNIIYREYGYLPPHNPSSHVKQFKRDFDKVVTASECKSDRTPLQLLIIATCLNRLQFIDHVNNLITWDDSKWKFSPGILSQLLFLVPFIPSRRIIAISRISEVYTGMDLELLVGLPINPSELNDDLFGRLLDRIHESGCENLVYEHASPFRQFLVTIL